MYKTRIILRDGASKSERRSERQVETKTNTTNIIFPQTTDRVRYIIHFLHDCTSYTIHTKKTR